MRTKITYRIPVRVENNYAGLRIFANIYSELRYIKNQIIRLDFSKNEWFEANLVSIMVAIVEDLKSRNCKVSLYNVANDVKIIFKKNGFYNYYNLGKVEDIYNSTIPFKVFNVLEDEKFTHYLDKDVLPKINLKLTEIQKRKFKNSLQEVFVNANDHAESKNVYTCGQYYHRNKKVAFTIVDTGVTIGKNVRSLKYNLSDSEAIDWATKFGNTTKVNEDGGIGLDLIKKYLKNKGTLQILSGNGYWEYDDNIIHKKEMENYFKGTIVNIISKLETETRKSNRFKPRKAKVIF